MILYTLYTDDVCTCLSNLDVIANDTRVFVYAYAKANAIDDYAESLTFSGRHDAYVCRSVF